MSATHCPHGIPIAEGVVCADCAAALAGADPNTNEPWQWWWGEGEQPERYHGPCNSRQEAIDEALSSNTAPPYSLFTICEATVGRLDDNHLDADWVIERFNEHNEDAADPDGDGVIDQTTPEQDRELEAMLKAAWVAWREKHNLGRAFMFDQTRNEELLLMPKDEGAEQ